MIRNYETEDLEKAIQIANEYTVAHPEWFPFDLPENNMPFNSENIMIGEDKWGFVYEQDGAVVGYITGYNYNLRGNVSVIVVDINEDEVSRAIKFWELMQRAGLYCQSAGCTNMQGFVAASNDAMLNAISDWGSLGEERKFLDTDFGGIVICEPEIELYLQTCENKLNDH